MGAFGFRPFRRKRRPDDGKYLPKDEKAWKRLVREARYTVRAPLADAMSLLKAAEACAKAVLPPGQARRDSPFLRLVLIGRQWWRMTHLDRIQKAADLERTAEACRAILEAAGGPPPRRPRADIDG